MTYAPLRNNGLKCQDILREVPFLVYFLTSNDEIIFSYSTCFPYEVFCKNDYFECRFKNKRNCPCLCWNYWELSSKNIIDFNITHTNILASREYLS